MTRLRSSACIRQIHILQCNYVLMYCSDSGVTAVRARAGGYIRTSAHLGAPAFQPRSSISLPDMLPSPIGQFIDRLDVP